MCLGLLKHGQLHTLHSSLTSWIQQALTQPLTSRSERWGRPPACTEAAAGHREILQSKLSQILASGSESDDESFRDPLEELPVEHTQAVASIGRAAYDVSCCFPACAIKHAGQ